MIRQVDNTNNDYINHLTQGQQKAASTAGQVDVTSLLLGDNQNDGSSNDNSIGSYDDQIELSPQAVKLLQEYQQTGTVSQPTDAVSQANAERVAYLKQLIQGGGTADYLNSIDNNTLAESILKHPLAPNLS